MNQRLLSLFKLLNESDENIPIKILSSKLKVSERTIRTDISALNSILNDVADNFCVEIERRDY